MPGIAGLIGSQPPDVCRRLLQQMLRTMHHEKYYVSGSHEVPELGVFAGWVAIEGSVSSKQPVLSPRNDVAVLFAGEFFDPHNAHSLIRLYERRGEHFVGDLNGLFSGLLIDRRQERTVLFNDRYGMERVYYHESPAGFFFASDAKALLRILPELRAYDNEGLAQFLRSGCTWGNTTLFRGIRRLPGASQWAITPGRCEKQRYFEPVTWEAKPQLSVKAFTAELENTLTRIMPRYFDSDSRIGISLTGGLDSRLILACQSLASRCAVSYTFAGIDGDTLDARLAARVASARHIPHHLLRLANDFFANFASLADRTVYITDGYFGVCGAHEIYLNRHARSLAPVRLTGNFGSEIFRAVTTFKPLGVSPDLFHPDVRRELLDHRSLPAAETTHPVSFAVFKEIPWHLFGVSRAAQSQITLRTPYLDNELVDLAFRVPNTLRNSPMPALQVVQNRDPRLAVIPTDIGLRPASRWYSSLAALWYRASFRLDYWRKEGLPHWLSAFDGLMSGLDGLLGSHRYLLYRRWFRSELAGYLREQLTDSQTLQNRLWNRDFLDQLAESHITGRRNYLREIDCVLTCAAIDRLLLRDSNASGPTVSDP
jgi:asparagine synthase (glutamine-hydrolysing)